MVTSELQVRKGIFLEIRAGLIAELKKPHLFSKFGVRRITVAVVRHIHMLVVFLFFFSFETEWELQGLEKCSTYTMFGQDGVKGA